MLRFALRIRFQLAKDPRPGLITAKVHCDAPLPVTARSICGKVL